MLCFSYLFYYNMTHTQITIDRIKTLGIFAILQFIYIIKSWQTVSGSYINAYTIFMLACYCFNLGQPVLEVFNAVALNRSVIYHYNIPLSTYYEAIIISLSFIMAFHLGAIACKQPSNRSTLDSYAPSGVMAATIERVSKVFMICSFPFYAYNTIIQMIVSATLGYMAIYEDIATIRLFTLIGDFYIPSAICYYFASEYLHKPTTKIWLIIIATIVFPPLYIGGRSNAIIIFAVILIIYSFFHQITWRKGLVILAITVMFVLSFTIIANTRDDVSGSSINVKESVNENNPFTFTLTEMGGSIQPLCHVLDMIPDPQPYRYGQSYLASLTTIIPNIGFWDEHPATKYANLGNWLKKELNINYGPGFSIVAEAYYNFGYYGFTLMFILGLLFTTVYKNVNRNTLLYNPLQFIVSVVFLWFTIKMVRNSFEFVVRAVAYYCLPLYISINYVYKKRINYFF